MQVRKGAIAGKSSGVTMVLVLSIMMLVSASGASAMFDEGSQEPPVQGAGVQEGTVEHYSWTGMIGCSISYPTGFQPWTCPDENNDREHNFTVGPGLETLIVTMEWESSTVCTADHLRHWFYAPSDAERPAVREEGTSPIEYRVDAGDSMDFPFEEIAEPTEFRFKVWGPASGANICYQQPFTVDYELHYGERPGEPPLVGWPELEDAQIRPGVNIVGGGCTANFIFSSPDNETLYIGTASHCVGGRQPGSSVSVGGFGAGILVYCSWMHIQGTSTCPSSDTLIDGNDFALVEIRDDHRHRVHPAMLHWGGPVGIGSPPSTLSKVHTYGNSGLNPSPLLSPMEGYTTGSSDVTTSMYTVRPGVFGDSGSPVTRADGQTVGVLVAINLVTGQNVIANLDNALSYMEDRTGIQVELKTWQLLNDPLVPAD